VELEVPKLVMVLAVLAALGGLGAWGHASATMEGRLADVRNDARSIGFSRGGRLPSVAEVRAQVEAIALARGVELDALAIETREAEGLGPVGSLAPQLAGALTGRQRVYAIRATGTTHAMIWTLSEPIEVDLSLRMSVSARPAGGARFDAAGPGASTDERGGLVREDDLGLAGRGL
jgi:hypothetical protein